jgi:hypothetical protein
MGEGFRVWTFGIDALLEVLAREPVASVLTSLTIDSPDLGGKVRFR